VDGLALVDVSGVALVDVGAWTSSTWPPPTRGALALVFALAVLARRRRRALYAWSIALVVDNVGHVSASSSSSTTWGDVAALLSSTTWGDVAAS
jgi:MYXO-CTERM domain-containing protein